MKKLTLLLILLGILSSCNRNDNTNEVDHALHGKWNLVLVTCECETINLESGEHIWTFDLTDNQLHVENNVTEQLHTLLETGTYPITFTNSKVTIQTVEYDYYFENDTLYLADHPELDGPLIEFVGD